MLSLERTASQHLLCLPLSRIVIYGDDMLEAVVPNSAKPFNFQEAFKLSEEQVS